MKKNMNNEVANNDVVKKVFEKIERTKKNMKEFEENLVEIEKVLEDKMYGIDQEVLVFINDFGEEYDKDKEYYFGYIDNSFGVFSWNGWKSEYEYENYLAYIDEFTLDQKVEIVKDFIKKLIKFEKDYEEELDFVKKLRGIVK